MKKGDVVKVYRDPITQNIPEGKAILREKLMEGGQVKGVTMEFWEVEFAEDGAVVKRWIMTSEPAPGPDLERDEEMENLRGLMIGSMVHESEGLFMKYFVLRPGKDDWHGRASRAALIQYAKVAKEHGRDVLANEIIEWVAQTVDVINDRLTLEGNNPIETEDPTETT